MTKRCGHELAGSLVQMFSDASSRYKAPATVVGTGIGCSDAKLNGSIGIGGVSSFGPLESGYNYTGAGLYLQGGWSPVNLISDFKLNLGLSVNGTIGFSLVSDNIDLSGLSMFALANMYVGTKFRNLLFVHLTYGLGYLGSVKEKAVNNAPYGIQHLLGIQMSMIIPYF